MSTYERNREANALSAISRQVAAQQHIAAAPAPEEEHAPVKRKHSAVDAPAATAGGEAGKPAAKEKRRKEKRRSTADAREQPVEASAPAGAAEDDAGNAAPASERDAPGPVPPAAGSAPAALDFRQWYVSEMAGCFEEEIEALHGAEGAVRGRVLARALGASAALFSPLERRLAVAGRPG